MSNTLEFETLDASCAENEEIHQPPGPEEVAAAKPVFLAAVERARALLAREAATDLSSSTHHRHGGHGVEEVPGARPGATDGQQPGGKSLRRKLVEP